MKTLGIDLGTTKVAAVILDENGTPAAVAGGAHHAALATDANAAEQDAGRIFACVGEQLAQLPAELRRAVSAVGITGQMHSVLLVAGRRSSPLITWQDRRCGETLLAEFRRRSGRVLREGFGGATLARLAGEKRLADWTAAATIGDRLAALLTGNSGIVTDPTHAASWGIYDSATGDWDRAAAAALGIPIAMLPVIRPSGSAVGVLCEEYAARFGLPAGIRIVNAIGDNQASILGTGRNFDEEVYLTLGTGAQLSLVLNENPPAPSPAVELRPFPGGRTLLVAAPLCGGAAFAWLADTVNAFRKALGEPELPRGPLLDKLDALALAAMHRTSRAEEIQAAPHFLGERYDPALRGRFDGLTLSNAEPGEIAAALATGIVRNLKQGFPPELLKHRKKVIGSGNAVRMLKSIQCAIAREFGLPLELSETREEAASGAARLAMHGA